MSEVENKKPIPIFVIGMNRSGTKWLSNELSRHSEISSVRNEVTGIRETNMFVAFANKFDISILDEYIGLVELWAATDFFKRTGVDKKILLEREQRPRSSVEVFEIVMDQFARLQNTKHWLQKTNPIIGSQLTKMRPAARFVIIVRNMKDQIRSNLARTYPNPGFMVIARAVFSYVRDKKILDRIVRETDCPVVKYESLKSDRENVLRNILTGWNLDPETVESDNDLKPNTSFGDNKKRADYFSGFNHFVISAVSFFANLIPASILVRNVERKVKTNRRTTAGTFVNVYEKHPVLRKK